MLSAGRSAHASVRSQSFFPCLCCVVSLSGDLCRLKSKKNINMIALIGLLFVFLHVCMCQIAVIDIDFNTCDTRAIRRALGANVNNMAEILAGSGSGVHLPDAGSFAELEFRWPTVHTGLSVGVWFRFGDS